MVDNIKIAVLGGDRRQIYALARLARGKRRVSVCGLPRETVCSLCGSEVDFADGVEDALEGASVILLPFPASTDGVRINCPLDTGSVLADVKLVSVIKLAKRGALIIGGKLPLPFVLAARDQDLAVVDLLESDDFEIKNAYITAEAALSVAMNSLSKNINGTKIAVTGFGRISKHLCRLLDLLGVSVTVCARRPSDLAFAETLGYDTQMIAGERWCDSLVGGYDIIYNTVPSRIFDRSFLESVDKKTLLIELASVPGGFDIAAAQDFSANISWALSLPGKYAPESAGMLIAECTEKLIDGKVGKI